MSQPVFLSSRAPCFDNLLAVLRRERPSRPTLFEFFFNESLRDQLSGDEWRNAPAEIQPLLHWVHAFRNAGYDYSTLPGWVFKPLYFPQPQREKAQSHSLNESPIIHDRVSFERYAWPTIKPDDYALLDRLEPYLPAGMKVIVHMPAGVLENAESLLGYENLCLLLVDDRSLVREVCDALGSRMLEHAERAMRHDIVGAVIYNDDWGFKTQTMIAPDDLREFVFPWARKIVAAAHAAGRPAILHSCGYFDAIIDDIIDDMKFDARHSYEDAIVPVEDAYERLQGRIAVLGGIDVDFLARRSPTEIAARCRVMLERTRDRGGYALGSGNSIPPYVPIQNYLAMIRSAERVDEPRH